LLVGEPGIGKTRLADELAMRAAAHPITTLWGRCWESGGAPAYWPWVQILRTYVSQLDAPTLAERVRAAPDLLHLLPNLRGPARGGGRGCGRTRRRRIASGCSMLLARSCAPRRPIGRCS